MGIVVAELRIMIDGTPDKRLSINAARRTHFRTKATISRDARSLAFYATIEAVPRSESMPLYSGAVRVSECVWWGKGQRAVDLDTLSAMCKPYLDGITDAGTVWNDDRQITELTVRQSRDHEGRGYVEITISASDAV